MLSGTLPEASPPFSFSAGAQAAAANTTRTGSTATRPRRCKLLEIIMVPFRCYAAYTARGGFRAASNSGAVSAWATPKDSNPLPMAQWPIRQDGQPCATTLLYPLAYPSTTKPNVLMSDGEGPRSRPAGPPGRCGHCGPHMGEPQLRPAQLRTHAGDRPAGKVCMQSRLDLLPCLVRSLRAVQPVIGPQGVLPGL